jgi:hypothetical protein
VRLQFPFSHLGRKGLGDEGLNQEIAAYFGASEEGVIKQMVQLQWQECFQAYLEEYEKAHITVINLFLALQQP